MDSARLFSALTLSLAASLSAYSAPLPDWLIQQSIAYNEQARDELTITCYQLIRNDRAMTCITLSMWCRIHGYETGVCAPPHELVGRFGP